VVIGVISSRTTPSGQGHEDTIKLAFRRVGDSLTVSGRPVRLDVRYEDDGGDPETAVQRARDLVENHKVVAILGPVSSDATKAVIGAELGVPIISSLSTSPRLTDPRNPWFFRATLNGRDRMAQYARFVTRDLKVSSGPHLVLCHTGEYGTGLCDGLTERLGQNEVIRKTWDEISATGEAQEATLQHLRAGAGFVPDLASWVSRANSIFVLGPSAGAVAIAQGMVQAFHPPGREPFFFVGSDTRLLLDAPEGAFTTGEPLSDLDDSAINTEARQRLEVIRNDFEISSPHPENFALPAFEVATFVIPVAMREALHLSGGGHDVATLRDTLRQVLDDRTFDSLTPARKLKFRQGSLVDPPRAPMLRIGRTFERKDAVIARPWINLDIGREPFRLFEGPITVVAQAYGLNGGSRVKIDALRLPDGPIEQSWEITHNGESPLQFHPTRRGKFRIQASVPLFPAEPEITLGYSPDYLLAVLGAAFGSLVAVLLSGNGNPKVARRRVALGVLTGLAVTLFSYYRVYFPSASAIPFPTLDGSPEGNAVFTGFLGGWLGLNVFGLLGKIPIFKVRQADALAGAPSDAAGPRQ
jgi:hypothetical protein